MTQPYPLYDNIILTPVINGESTLEIHPFLEPLLYKVAERHPDWTIQQSNHSWLNGKLIASDFKVIYTATKEELGNLGVDVRRSPSGRETVFSIYNQRIQSKRERGHSFRTGKINDALKVIKKEFYPLTIKERIKTAWEQGEWYLTNSLRSARRDLEEVQGKLGKVALSVVRRAHWEIFMEVLTDVSPELAKKATELDDIVAQYDKAEELHSKFQSKKLLTVIIDDDKYIVSDNSGDMRTYSSDDLPEQIKQQVGLLKLVEEKEPIPGVGLRVGHMYIINAVI